MAYGYRRKGKKNYKRRTYRRKKNSPRRAILSGFPKSKLVKLRYVETNVNLNASAISPAQYVFRANSVFDPNYSASGHQPMGFDQWAALYTHYTVVGSKIEMRYAPDALADRTYSSYFGVMLDTSLTGTSAFSTVNNLLESKLTRNYRMVGQNSNAGSGNKKPYPSCYKQFSAKKFFGITNVNDGSANSATMTTNPGNEAYFICWAAAPGALDPDVLNFTVIIDYIVLFRDPKTLNGS